MFHLSTTAMPRDELERRRDAVLAAMHQQGIDQAIFTTPANVYYLTGIQLGGFTTPQALILDASGAHVFVYRLIEYFWYEHWAPMTWCDQWRPYGDGDSPDEAVIAAAKSLRPGNPRVLALEIDRTSLSFASVQRIQDGLGAQILVSSAPLVERLRRIKSPLELEYMRRAGEITRMGIEAAAAAFKAGATEAEAAGAAFDAMCRGGSEYFGMNPWVSSGPKSAMAHQSWSDERPRPGDVVPLFMSACVRRYMCRIERTYVMGEPDPETARMLDVLVQCVEYCMQNIRAGMTSHEADKLARDFIEEAGYGQHFMHRLAYGIGVAFPPNWGEGTVLQLRPNDPTVLQPGMTVHLVPAFHVRGIGFLNRSMPVVITEKGCEPLTTMPLRVEPL